MPQILQVLSVQFPPPTNTPQTRTFSPDFFRFRLTTGTLAFDYILPTAGRIWDFKPPETRAARRTTIKMAAARSLAAAVLIARIFQANCPAACFTLHTKRLFFQFYKNIYLHTNKIANTYINGVIFLLLPHTMLIIT